MTLKWVLDNLFALVLSWQNYQKGSATMLDVYHGDNLEILKDFPNESFDLIYIDPPFNTRSKANQG